MGLFDSVHHVLDVVNPLNVGRDIGNKIKDDTGISLTHVLEPWKVGDDIAKHIKDTTGSSPRQKVTQAGHEFGETVSHIAHATGDTVGDIVHTVGSTASNIADNIKDIAEFATVTGIAGAGILAGLPIVMTGSIILIVIILIIYLSRG